MKDLPKNSKSFFEDRFKEVIFREDWIFVERLEKDPQLRNFVYPSLNNTLDSWQKWEIFLTLVVDCAGLMHADRTEKVREDRKRAEKLKKSIIDKCNDLANTIDELDELGEQGCIDVAYSDCPISLIIEAGKNNSLFRSYLSKNLSEAIVGFDLKYMPSVQSVIRQIGVCYSEQEISYSYNYKILNKRASSRDFCIKLYSCIKEFIRVNSLPKNFKLRQIEIADFCNALLPDKQIITSDNVKTYISEFNKTQSK